jgi:AcrR family transcriptional regulator
MDSDSTPTDSTNGAPEDPRADDALNALITDEMGETMAELMRRSRRAQEAWHRDQNPDEGLRERNRRLTRQLISDAATALFVTRGFDHVNVSEVADRVGVSTKTIYNYFPTKEAMVLDGADKEVQALADALRNRLPDQSITEAVVSALKADMDRYDQVPEALIQFLPKFVTMIETTPPLRAAWLELHDRLARVARDELAATAGVDAREPEPTVAGRALAGLAEIAIQSRVRHAQAGLREELLRQAICEDLDRAARLLETGLWSFNLLRTAHAGHQAGQTARAAERSRVQVLESLTQAQDAWADVRKRQDPAAAQAERDAALRARRDAQAAKAAKAAKAQARRDAHAAKAQARRDALASKAQARESDRTRRPPRP